MTDQNPPVDPLVRLADAVETLVGFLIERLPPPRQAPRVEETPIPADQLYMAGQFKRRPGNIIPGPSTRELHTGSPPIGTQLDPWVRRDVPAIEPMLGQAGLVKETDTASSNAVDSGRPL